MIATLRTVLAWFNVLIGLLVIYAGISLLALMLAAAFGWPWVLAAWWVR